MSNKTDKQEFIDFFEKMGVVYELNFGIKEWREMDTISVAQAHFEFDSFGRFDQVVCDETGRIERNAHYEQLRQK